MHLVVYLENNPQITFAEENPLDDFSFVKIDRESYQEGLDIFSDTMIYESVDDKLDEYRKLISHLQIQGKYYQLEIVKPHLEANEIISTLAITLSGLLLGITLSFYILQRVVSRKLWNPFLNCLRH